MTKKSPKMLYDLLIAAPQGNVLQHFLKENKGDLSLSFEALADYYLGCRDDAKELAMMLANEDIEALGTGNEIILTPTSDKAEQMLSGYADENYLGISTFEEGTGCGDPIEGFEPAVEEPKLSLVPPDIDKNN
jgi:hypothetical protein